MLNTNCEAQLCKMIYLCFPFMLQKGCLKLDPLLSMAATTSFAHLVSFPEDPTVLDNMTPPPCTSQVSIHTQFTINHQKINFHTVHPYKQIKTQYNLFHIKSWKSENSGQ